MNVKANIIVSSTTKNSCSKTDIFLGKVGSLMAAYTVLYGLNYILARVGVSIFWALLLSVIFVVVIILAGIFVSVLFFPANEEEYRKRNYSKLANTLGDLLEKLLLPVVVWM